MSMRKKMDSEANLKWKVEKYIGVKVKELYIHTVLGLEPSLRFQLACPSLAGDWRGTFERM